MTQQLAITSNYAASTGDPQPYLERIAEAGFTHVLWAHHAWSDYIYTDPEIEHIARCLEATGLALRRHRMGITRAIREERYQRILGVTGADAKRAFLDMLHEHYVQSAVCVLASRPDLEAAGRDLPSPLVIEDILK